MFVAFGIILLIAGGIITFAVDAEVSGLDLSTIGVILMIAGAGSLIAGAFQAAAWQQSAKSKFTSERHVSPDGQHVVEETRAE